MGKNKDGRVIARDNEVRVLRALHRFGWLRTRDIAALVHMPWASKAATAPSPAPVAATASALRMAQRTVRRMRDARLLLSATGPDGSTVWALAEAGTRALQGMGVVAASGKDAVRKISSAYFRHRCISNEIAIAGIVQGLRVSTEREIARGLWAGGETGIGGKKPDVLWRNGTAWTWVEVQRSRHNAKDYAQLIAWLKQALQLVRHPGTDIAPGAKLARIVFICSAALQDRMTKDLLQNKFGQSEIYALISFNTSLYRLETISFC
jgi:hypothetical protein